MHSRFFQSNFDFFRDGPAMALPIIKKFLCCISLEAGAFIIGWLNLIAAIVLLLASISAIVWVVIARYNGEFESHEGFIGGFAGRLEVLFVTPINYSHFLALMIFLVLFANYNILIIISASYLLEGVNKVGRPGKSHKPPHCISLRHFSAITS